MMTVDSETQGSVSVSNLSSCDVSLPSIEDLTTVTSLSRLRGFQQRNAALHRFLNDDPSQPRCGKGLARALTAAMHRAPIG